VKVAASTRARYKPPSLSVSTTAQTYLEVRVGFWVLLILPIVQAKAALPRFGHGQIVLPAQRIWEVIAICAVGGTGGPPCYDANCSSCTDVSERVLTSVVLVNRQTSGCDRDEHGAHRLDPSSRRRGSPRRCRLQCSSVPGSSVPPQRAPFTPGNRNGSPRPSINSPLHDRRSPNEL
jgi:hypothetical protein